MKLRNSFVSNSSSTSFAIYGLEMRENEYIQFINFVLNLNLSENHFSEMMDSCDDELCNLNKQVYDKTGMDTLFMSDYNRWYIGRDCASLKDYETGFAFRKSVDDVFKNCNISDEPSYIYGEVDVD